MSDLNFSLKTMKKVGVVVDNSLRMMSHSSISPLFSSMTSLPINLYESNTDLLSLSLSISPSTSMTNSTSIVFLAFTKSFFSALSVDFSFTN